MGCTSTCTDAIYSTLAVQCKNPGVLKDAGHGAYYNALEAALANSKLKLCGSFITTNWSWGGFDELVCASPTCERQHGRPPKLVATGHTDPGLHSSCEQQANDRQ